MLDFDLSFPHSYAIEEIGDFPGDGKFPFDVHYIPDPRTRKEHEGLWLKVSSRNCEPWIGVFAFAYDSPPALTRIVSTPHPDQACIVAKGGAYLVKAADPHPSKTVPILPVLDIRPIVHKNLVIFSDFIRLAAIGENGIAWQSPRVCWDNLKILTVTENSVEGIGYDPTSAPHEMRFAIDLNTGRSLLPLPLSLG